MYVHNMYVCGWPLFHTRIICIVIEPLPDKSTIGFYGSAGLIFDISKWCSIVFWIWWRYTCMILKMAKFDEVNYIEIEPVSLLRYSVTLIGFSDSIHVTIISMHKEMRNNTIMLGFKFSTEPMNISIKHFWHSTKAIISAEAVASFTVQKFDILNLMSAWIIIPI